MTDLENSGTPAGEVVPTTASQGQPATSSQATPDLESLLKKVSDLEGQVRSLQSGKDKATYKLEKDVGTLKETIAKYEELRAEGLSQSRALKEMQLDALLEKQTPADPLSTSTPQAQGSAPATQTGTEMAAVLQELGLTANDPQVIEAMRLPAPKLVAALAKLAVERNQAPNPAVLQNTGGGSAVVGTDDLAAIVAKLEVLKAQPPHLMDRKEYGRLVKEYNRLVQQQ